MEDFPINTKSDLVLECAEDAAKGLLMKWPDLKTKLRVTFNQPLPHGLRNVAWKLFLENTIGETPTNTFALYFDNVVCYM